MIDIHHKSQQGLLTYLTSFRRGFIEKKFQRYTTQEKKYTDTMKKIIERMLFLDILSFSH